MDILRRKHCQRSGKIFVESDMKRIFRGQTYVEKFTSKSNVIVCDITENESDLKVDV